MLGSNTRSEQTVDQFTRHRFITWNINGLNNPTKRREAILYLSSTKPSWVCVQESHLKNETKTKKYTKSRKEQKNEIPPEVDERVLPKKEKIQKNLNILKNLKKKLKMKYIAHESAVGHYSNITLGKEDLEKVYEDDMNTILCTYIQIDDLRILLVNIHASHDAAQYKKSLSDLQTFIDEQKHVNGIIMAGDFNLDLQLDTGYKKKALTAFMRINDLVPVTTDKPTREARKIDYFLLSSSLRSLVENIDLTYNPWSDHAILTLDLAIPSKFKSSSQWYMNSSILENPRSKRKIEDLLEDHLDSNDWIRLKAKIQDLLKTEAILANRKKRNNLKVAIEEYNKIAGSTIEGRIKLVFLEHLHSKINRIVQYMIDGAALRSKQQLYEPSEKPTRQFFAYEKLFQSKKSCATLEGCKNNDDSMVECIKYYSDLYDTKVIDHQEADKLKKLLSEFPKMEKALLSAEFTDTEVSHAIKISSSRSSPGLDGLPFTLYKTCSFLFSAILRDFFNSIHMLPQEVHKDLFTSKMILIYKKGNNKDIRNYRPISITNCDVRLFSSILATRLNKVLMDYTSPWQCGFTYGRSTYDAILTIQHVIRRAVKDQLPLAILLLDWEKAYDRISHKYLAMILNHLCGESSKFTDYIKMMYQNSYFKICFNNRLSDLIPMRSGVRQGCPISPLLFNLCIEPMIEMIEKDQQIIGAYDVKQVYFADDSTFILRNVSDLEKITQVLGIYERASGAKQNRSKSIAQIINNASDLKDAIIRQGYTTTDQTTTLLGCPIGPTVRECEIWDEPIRKAEMSIGIWAQKSLSLIGKQLIANSKLLSRLIYRCGIFKMPPPYIKKVNNLIKRFLFPSRAWCRSTPWLAQKNIGGLGIIDIEDMNDALLSKIALQLQHDKKAIWMPLAKAELGDLWKTYMGGPHDYEKYIPDFWRTIRRSANRTLFLHNQRVETWEEISSMQLEYDPNDPILPITAGEVFGLPPDQSGRRSRIKLHIRRKFRISEERFLTVMERIRRKTMIHFNAVTMKWYGKKIYKPIRANTRPFYLQQLVVKEHDRILPHYLYTTKYGRLRRSAIKYQSDQVAHKYWSDLVSQDEWALITSISKPKFYPNMYLSFRWRLRHLCLFHFHFGQECAQCGKPLVDIRHVLVECDVAARIWDQVSTSLGVEISEKEILFGPLDKRSPIWKHRIKLVICLHEIWKAYWRRKIDNTMTNINDLLHHCKMENIAYAPYYADKSSRS